MKYCIFSGTFNPVHNAHVKMAQKVLEEFNFGKILFIPAYMQPQKDLKECEISAPHRLNMLKLALCNKPQFQIELIEFERKGLSYTYTTILELYKKLHDIDGKINFIIGTDAFLNIYSWKEAEELVKLIDFIVLIRDENELKECKKLTNLNYKVLNSDKINISSTIIREMVKLNQDISDLVPKNVHEYIKENDLYRD